MIANTLLSRVHFWLEILTFKWWTRVFFSISLVSNKPVLSQTELPDISMEIVKTAGAAVQFKALAVLRLLVQEQS